MLFFCTGIGQTDCRKIDCLCLQSWTHTTQVFMSIYYVSDAILCPRGTVERKAKLFLNGAFSQRIEDWQVTTHVIPINRECEESQKHSLVHGMRSKPPSLSRGQHQYHDPKTQTPGKPLGLWPWSTPHALSAQNMITSVSEKPSRHS